MYDEIWGTRGERRMPHLTCERCGVRYREGAMARQPTLVCGATCRRCGGRLQPHEPDAGAEGLDAVVAVRSAIGEPHGVPFG